MLSGRLGLEKAHIPHESLSIVLLGPGSSVSHDALRLLARHGCALAAIGEGQGEGEGEGEGEPIAAPPGPSGGRR